MTIYMIKCIQKKENEPQRAEKERGIIKMMNRTELTKDQMEAVVGGDIFDTIYLAAGNLGNKIAVGVWTTYSDARKTAETKIDTAIEEGKELYKKLVDTVNSIGK